MKKEKKKYIFKVRHEIDDSKELNENFFQETVHLKLFYKINEIFLERVFFF